MEPQLYRFLDRLDLGLGRVAIDQDPVGEVEVEVLVPVLVPDPGALAPVDERGARVVRRDRISELEELGMRFLPSSNSFWLFFSFGTSRAIGIGSGTTSASGAGAGSGTASFFASRGASTVGVPAGGVGGGTAVPSAVRGRRAGPGPGPRAGRSGNSTIGAGSDSAIGNASTRSR